ncbi:MAG: sigma-54 dependent transcriptional regulator [Pseudomonadota bacterium]
MPASQSNVSILIAEKRASAAQRMQEILSLRGHEVSICQGAEECLALAEQNYFDLIFLAERLAGASTAQLVSRLVDLFPETIVSIISPEPTVPAAVEALRLGAFDFVPDPQDEDSLLYAVEQALQYRRLRRENGERRREITQKYDVQNIVGQSRPMQDVFRMIHKVAATDASVLILGESGTGKELVARAIHAQSGRDERPLVPVNCGAIPAELLESELFGHEKGAFTGAIKTRLGRFELAEGGTIFLDEVGDMSPMLQVKLLRVLQEHQFERIGGTKTISVDIRVIAATHRDLKKRVEEGTFREDLYYRLNVVPIKVPPLRERRSDIPLLADYFLERLGRLKGLGHKRLHPEVLERLMRHHWPGNVRELENLLERLVILSEGDLILLEDLPPKLAGPGALPPLEPAEIPALVAPSAAPAAPEFPEEGLDFNAAVDEFERSLITTALERTGWVKNQAAALLKLNRTTLVEKIKKKGINAPGEQALA